MIIDGKLVVRHSNTCHLKLFFALLIHLEFGEDNDDLPPEPLSKHSLEDFNHLDQIFVHSGVITIDHEEEEINMVTVVPESDHQLRYDAVLFISVI